MDISVDRFDTKLSEITHQLFEEYRYDYAEYEVLVAISGTRLLDGKSNLRHVFQTGRIEPVPKFHAIGSGAPYGLVYIKELFNKNPTVTMNQAAELGFFIIKYIEKYKLDNTVGLGTDCKNKYPQIHFIPDIEPDYPATEEQLRQMEESSKNRLDKINVL